MVDQVPEDPCVSEIRRRSDYLAVQVPTIRCDGEPIWVASMDPVRRRTIVPNETEAETSCQNYVLFPHFA